MYTLLPSKLFDADVDSAYQYIKDNLEAPKAAETLMKELKQKLNYLKESPFTRSYVQDEFLASMELRPIKVKNYVIFARGQTNQSDPLRGKQNEIHLIRFLYNKRDWKNILREK